MEVPVIEALPGKGRKRKRQPEKWKANKAKIDRYSSPSLPENITCNHNTKSFACKQLKILDLVHFHRSFYSKPNKQHQDALILKCCSVKKTARKRPVKNVRKSRAFSIKYAIYAKSLKKAIPVCQKVFLNTLGITKYRVQFVMQNFFESGRVPTEKRGGDRKTQKFAAQRQSVHSFLKSLNCVEAHYCRGSSQQRKYLPSELNIKKIYKLFKQAHPNSPVKSSYFRSIFNQDFNLGFGSPRRDVCSKCLELQEKLKNENDTSKKNLLMIEKRIHKLRAQTFFKLLREKEGQMITFSFDCQKNLVLPKVPDQSCYYSRQLYLYNFTIVQGSSKDPLNKNTTYAYIWTENEYAKGSNQIASAVYDRLNKTDLTDVTHVRLVADGCAGQNKNYIMISMCMRWLLENRHVKKMELVFPITGHSFMPPDRVFGNIEKQIRKLEVITSPEEYIAVISEHSTVTQLRDIPVLDWKSSINSIVKTPAQIHFKISQCKRFILRRSKKQGSVLVRGELYYNSDTGNPKSLCKPGKKAEDIRPTIIPSGIQVNPLKLRDVRNLLQKHYGDSWKNLAHLRYFHAVLNHLDEDELRLLEERGVEENDTVEDLCEVQEEGENLSI
ncbi:unnamed protein product [Colias eurytheme]|nr:unnamed protein product [Colias eurytheme]